MERTELNRDGKLVAKSKLTSEKSAFPSNKHTPRSSHRREKFKFVKTRRTHILQETVIKHLFFVS
jgi:hypothetical protein